MKLFAIFMRTSVPIASAKVALFFETAKCLSSFFHKKAKNHLNSISARRPAGCSA